MKTSQKAAYKVNFYVYWPQTIIINIKLSVKLLAVWLLTTQLL